MFVSPKFAFVELQKTGTSQIRKILSHVIEGRLSGAHNQAGPALFNDERVFLGSIRNPWDWYISLWSFGCWGRGQTFHSVTGTGHRAWADAYGNINDAEGFRTWLQMLLDPVYASHVGEGFSRYPLHLGAGLMTFRYLRLFCNKRGEKNGMEELLLYEQLREYEQRHNFIDHFIRNETLEEDLFEVLERYGLSISAEKKAEILAFEKSKLTPRKRDLLYYYDSAAQVLVAHKERLIIEKFGYAPPDLQ